MSRHLTRSKSVQLFARSPAVKLIPRSGYICRLPGPHGFHSQHPNLSFNSTVFARDKGSQYTLETTEAERITDLLNFYRLRRWGFVIYRCTYGDDVAWSRFLDHLNKRKDYVLEDCYCTPELAASIDWNVQEDPALDGASKDEVRRRFKQWVASDACRTEFPADMDASRLQCLLAENPRYNYCIHVDADSLDSVINRGPPPTEPDMENISYVNLIRADDAWEALDFDRCDWSRRKLVPDQEEDPFDEGEPEVEGSRLSDVGWMKVSPDGLVPGVYDILTRSAMWDVFYCRPPQEILRR